METADIFLKESFKVFHRVAKIYFQFEALGVANLPDLKNENVLFVMSHTAFFGLDGYLLAGQLAELGIDRPLRTLVWRRFLDGPMGRWFKTLGCIDASVENASEALLRGENVVVMPEGTDATDVRNRINTFHTGYLRIAQRVPGLKIVPLGFYGVDQAIPWWVTTNKFIVKKMMEPLDIGLDFYLLPKVPFPRPTKVVFAFGEPITYNPQDLETETALQSRNREMRDRIRKLIDQCEEHRDTTIKSSLANTIFHKLVGGETTILPWPL